MQTTSNILQIGIGNVKYTLRHATEIAATGLQQGLDKIQYKNMTIDYKHIEDSHPFGGGFATTTSSWLMSTQGYNIVHSLSQHPYYLKNKGNTITIGTAHEMAEISFPDLARQAAVGIKGKLWRQTVTLLGIKSLLASDYACATSHLTRQGLIESGFQKENIFLTPLGIAPEFLSIPLPEKEPEPIYFVTGTLGCQGPQKNTFFTIQAFHSRPWAGERLEIWGNSIYNQKQLQEAIGTDPRIKIMGPASPFSKVHIYDDFDVFVFPSLFEGFGIPIKEAQARGLPVILWKEGKISPEVRKHCLLAKDPEHMAELIGKIRYNGYNAKLRKKAIADARQYTLARTGRAILKAYENILGEM